MVKDIVRKNIKKKRLLRLRYIIIGVFLFSAAIIVIDAIIDYSFFYERDFYSVLFPPINSHEFFVRLMIVANYLLFALIISYAAETKFKIELKLIESEAKFRTMANYTKDMEYWIAPDRTLNFISPSVEQITGYMVEEFMQNPSLIHDIIDEEDRKIFSDHENIALAGQEMQPIEFRIRRKDGSVIWVHHSCQSVWEENKYMGHRVSNRDITQRKEYEFELKKLNDELHSINENLEHLVKERTEEVNQIFRQSPYGKAICDASGNIIETNEAWDQIFSDSKNRDEKKLSAQDIVNHKEIKDTIDECISYKDISKSQSVYLDELDKILIFDAYPILKDNGEISKIVVNVQDITDKVVGSELFKELGEQKSTLLKVFEHLELERSRVSKELHDQIGQKLTLTKLNVDMLRQKYPEEDKLNEIINLLADTNREIREIIHSLFPAELEKYGLLESLDLMVHNCSKAGNFKCNFSVSGDNIRLDKIYELNIYRICTEIFNNIVKHSHATEVKVQVELNPKYFNLIVKDNGIGFDSNKKSYGLGTISMQQRVKVINGDLEIVSGKNKGTEIYLSIPLEEES